MRSQGTFVLLGILMLAAAPARARDFDTQSAWLPEVEQLYRADVHYSLEAACRALVRDVIASVPEGEAVAFRVHATREDLRRCVQRTLGDLADPPGGSQVDLVVGVETTEHAPAQLVFAVDAWETMWSVPFVTKPWVESSSPDGYVTVRGLSANDLVGARHDVLEEAVNAAILPRIRKQFSYWRGNRSEALARRHIRRALDSGDLVVDRFEQTFFKTIADEEHVALIREAVQLDLRENNIAPIMRSLARDQHRLERRATTGLSAAALLVLTAVLVTRLGYVFLNRVTQGYYVWPIRCMAAAVLFVTLGVAAKLTISILNAL